jgi:hypothetical protein
MSRARLATMILSLGGLSLVLASTLAASDAYATPDTAKSIHAVDAVHALAAKAARDEGDRDAVSGACPAGMVEIEGDYCPTVTQKCVKWMDSDKVHPRRCAEFAPSGACPTKTVKKHFCVDEFEYPNKAGEQPVVMKSFVDAQKICASEGKRLCGSSEWTLACEGAQRLPYPYGLERDSAACNIDKPHPKPNEKALASPRTRDAEVARLWQGEPSGSRDACVSPYGVHDMTGNVDEWVVNEGGKPFASGLKGGYWGPVRDRCRPMTTAHGPEFSYYQVGFRCCSDAG